MGRRSAKRKSNMKLHKETKYLHIVGAVLSFLTTALLSFLYYLNPALLEVGFVENASDFISGMLKYFSISYIIVYIVGSILALINQVIIVMLYPVWRVIKGKSDIIRIGIPFIFRIKLISILIVFLLLIIYPADFNNVKEKETKKEKFNISKYISISNIIRLSVSSVLSLVLFIGEENVVSIIIAMSIFYAYVYGCVLMAAIFRVDYIKYSYTMMSIRRKIARLSGEGTSEILLINRNNLVNIPNSGKYNIVHQFRLLLKNYRLITTISSIYIIAILIGAARAEHVISRGMEV